MNKRMLFLVGLFSLSTVPFSVSAEAHKRVNKDMSQFNAQLRSFLSSYMGAVVMGGCAGVAAGSVVAYVQNKVIRYLKIESSLIKLILMIGACNFGSELLGNIIAGLETNLDLQQIEYQDGPMEQSALISSVLAYFHA